MKRILLIVAVLLMAAPAAHSQSWLERVGKNAAKRAEERAKQKVEDKVNKKVDETVDKVLDAPGKAIEGAKDKEVQPTAEGQTGQQTTTPGVNPADPKSVEMAYAKSDFVPGDVIIFEDDVTREQLGEFPSMWDLRGGVAETATLNGEKVINLQGWTTINPLMKDGNAYLTDEFTVELDFFLFARKEGVYDDKYKLYFHQGNGENEIFSIQLYPELAGEPLRMEWNWHSGGERKTSRADIPDPTYKTYHRLAVSFNKRALKVYVDGIRYVSLPNITKPDWFAIEHAGFSDDVAFIRNVRVAKGAVPLYDRMMSDGKIITYGITFDVGKSTIKPESMAELTRIVALMNENPTLKFSVEGHTDSTGSETGNQTLSEQRSQAVMAKLVEMGIAADRLSASGKGQSNPIADNNTDEGRAKNRRVEFVKL